MNAIPSKDKRPHVCFYTPYSYPLFNAEYQGDFGGSEVRCSIIAKELAKREWFKVTILVADCGQPHVEYRHGVQLVSLSSDSSGNSMDGSSSKEVVINEGQKTRKKFEVKGSSLRRWKSIINNKLGIVNRISRIKWLNKYSSLVSFILSLYLLTVRIFYSLTSPFSKILHNISKPRKLFEVVVLDNVNNIWQDEVAVLDEVDADLYIVPGNHHMSTVIAHYCLVRKKKYIFLAGSDKDYAEEILTHPGASDVYGVRHCEKMYAIKHANYHILQTQKQASMLEKFDHYPTEVIRNPIDLTYYYARARKNNMILWVGNSSDNVKRPSLVLRLARQLPQCECVMVLKIVGNDLYRWQYSLMTSKLPNVTMKTYVPLNEIEKYYAQANIYINTSTFEGFPNTFLQAAKYGVPIIATDVDPDGMLSQHGCGITCGGDFERFVYSVQRTMTDLNFYADMSTACLQYVNKYHDKEIIIPQYEEIFRKISEE